MNDYDSTSTSDVGAVEADLETVSDQLDPARATAMMALLGAPSGFVTGQPLPPFFHQLYFWKPLPETVLGRDGHPKVGTPLNPLIPDMGLPRRMWAGGRLEFRQRLFCGRVAEKRSYREDVVARRGRSGPLVFVTLRHEFWQDGQHCLTEWQDLVYREDPEIDTTADAPNSTSNPETARKDETLCETQAFSTTQLFRYSALTFNGHRIHYDLDYARGVEGYPGLVVHGPLLAQRLMLLAESQIGPLAEFTFRATSPVCHEEEVSFCLVDHDLWVRGSDGRLCMRASAVPA